MLSKEWSDYDPKEGYEKKIQDVILKDGRRIYYCWPNAGYWHIMSKELNPETYGQDIKTSETKKVRLTKHDI